MAKELQDWIVPWIDDHYNKYGTDTTKVYGDGKKVQIIEFETYRNHADPSDKTQIVALATDSVHRVRLVFDREMTDRFYKAKGYPITRDLRSLYSLKEYKILIPLFLFPSSPTTSTSDQPVLDPTFRPKSHHNLFTILVSQAEWYWGSSSEPNFCSSPIDVRLTLSGQDGRISAYAQGYRDKVVANLKRKEKRSRSRERSVMSETELQRMEVYEEVYKRGGIEKEEESVRRDAKAVLEIFVEEARLRSIKGQQQGMNVIIEGEAEEEDADDIEMDDPGSPISPKGNSYEAPPFQVPQPNFSLSHPTPENSSGEAVRSNDTDSATPTKTSSRAPNGSLRSSPINAMTGSKRNKSRRPEDDYDEDDPVVKFLLRHAEASSSASSPPTQPDPMELYELLVKDQLEGRSVDWAFKPSERWMGGEEGLKRVLEGVKVFGLDLAAVEGEEEDDEEEDDKEEEAVVVEDAPIELEAETRDEDVAMMEPDEQPEEVVLSLPCEPSNESQMSSTSQNSGRMMKRRRRTRSRERERGRSSETRPLDPSPQVMFQPKGLEMEVEERERSPSLVWEPSPEPVRPRLQRPSLAVQDPMSVSMEAKEYAEVIDGMLTSQSDEEEEIQVTVGQVQKEGSASRQASADPGETSEVEIPQAAPHKRPNVQRISLGSPSSGEEEERPGPSVGLKRKASVDSPFIHQPAISERERSKRQKLEEIKRLQEEVERLEADVDGSEVEMLEESRDQHVVERVRSMSVDSTRSASFEKAQDIPAPIAELETRPGRPSTATSRSREQSREQEQFKSSPVQQLAHAGTDLAAAVVAPSRSVPSKAFLLLPAYGLRISEVHTMQIELPKLLRRN